MLKIHAGESILVPSFVICVGISMPVAAQEDSSPEVQWISSWVVSSLLSSAFRVLLHLW